MDTKNVESNETVEPGSVVTNNSATSDQPSETTDSNDALHGSDTATVVTFPNKRQATLVRATSDTSVSQLVSSLGLSRPEALLLMVGGVANLNPQVSAHLVQLFSRGIANALSGMNALVLDNGLNAGAIQMMGQGVADRGHKTTLVGVAPADQVAVPGTTDVPPEAGELEPNHSHFILTPGQSWGDETELLTNVATALAEPQPVVTILVAGDDVAKKQVLHAVRQGWPVVVMKESGGLANDVANLAQERPPFIEDPDLAEIIIDGKLYFIQSTGPISAFERLLEQLLSNQHSGTEPSTLELVWNRFAQYDQSANQQQHDFGVVQKAILGLGVTATLLAIIQTYYKNSVGEAITTDVNYQVIDWSLYVVLLLLPITISILIAGANRFSAGNKWILLRAGAESLKKEIYRYRTRIDIYSDQQTRQISREMQLHRKEEAINRKLMQTEVNATSLKKYDGPIPPLYGAADGDDGLSFLTPDRYVKLRLEDQLKYYQSKTQKIEKQMKQLQWIIYILGGVGTFLVAIGLEIWIAFTTSVVTALTTYMEYRQLETTLMRYNQTAAELTSLRSWWIALTNEEQADPANISQLVDQTETTIHSEHAAWVQEMQDAMAELRAAQTDEKSSSEARDRQMQAKAAG